MKLKPLLAAVLAALLLLAAPTAARADGAYTHPGLIYDDTNTLDRQALADAVNKNTFPQQMTILLMLTNDPRITKDNMGEAALDLVRAKYDSVLYQTVGKSGRQLKPNTLILIIAPNAGKVLVHGSSDTGFAVDDYRADALRPEVYNAMIPPSREKKYDEAFKAGVSALATIFQRQDTDARNAARQRAYQDSQDRAAFDSMLSSVGRGAGALGMWVLAPLGLAAALAFGGRRFITQAAAKRREAQEDSLTVSDLVKEETLKKEAGEKQKLLAWSGPSANEVNAAMSDWESVAKHYQEAGLSPDSVTAWALEELQAVKDNHYGVTNAQRGDREWRASYERATSKRGPLIEELLKELAESKRRQG